MEVVNAIGRRKAAIARVYVSEGNGQILVNKRDYKEYFPLKQLHYVVNQPLMLTESEGKYDIKVNLCGGGIKGQAEAARLAITRALVQIDEENNKETLKANKLLTRDSRVVERKKPGRPKARKRFQFSKR
ncbi:MAG: 30S ribosomal protein S9 [Bacteroidales bacterium]|nr:30S ribosomal protein S9 [Bacteroidales bacterium]